MLNLKRFHNPPLKRCKACRQLTNVEKKICECGSKEFTENLFEAFTAIDINQRFNLPFDRIDFKNRFNKI